MINIVKEFEQNNGFVSASKVFVIQGRDYQGDFSVNRTYSDFVTIRQLLAANFDKVPLFRLPPETPHVFSFLSFNLNFHNRVKKE